MKIVKSIATGVLLAGMVTGVSTASFAGGHGFKCKVSEESMAKPGGFPDRALTMIVPYGPVVVQVRLQQQWPKPLLTLPALTSTATTNQVDQVQSVPQPTWQHQQMATMFSNISMTHHQRMRLTL